MEIVMIEARTYEAMMSRFEEFSAKVDTLHQRYGGKGLNEWLDSQDVCMMLGISKRTLQSLRDSGKLGYTMVGRKAFYKPKDVQAIIGNANTRKEDRNGK